MVIANPPLAEPVIDPGGVTIKPPFEMGVANLTISLLSLVESFYDECKDKSRCKEIMRRWAEENSKIANQIHKILE